MPSFGEKLKLEREKRAITLDQISLTTKIGTRLLQALEEDKFNQLPGGIFNKGFVRAYARCVGLDEEQTVADYLEASGEGAPAKSGPGIEAEPMPLREAPPSSSRPLPWGLLAVLLLVVALGLSLWSRRQHANERHPSAPPVAAQKPVADRGASTSNATNSPEAAAPKPNAMAPAKPETASAPASATSPAAGIDSTETANLGTDVFTVTIVAREESWISATADGKPLFAYMIEPGNQRVVHARKELVVKAGNIGALDFVFNGKTLASQGGYGEVKTLTFGSGGLLANAPAPAVAQ